MKKLSRESQDSKLPIKVVQFGEGNFLRAFVDYAFQELNDKADYNGGIAVVQPIEQGMVSMLNDQDGLYTLFLRGVKNGEVTDTKQIISNIVKGINPYEDFQSYLDLAKEDALEVIISNTTEAGIAYVEGDQKDACPPVSYPAKLTRLLWERFNHFDGATEKGLAIIPCELINYNADNLKRIILQYAAEWNLGEGFTNWIQESNTFHNTLVDRIVPGYPRNEIDEYNAKIDYQDNIMVVAETFFLWVIEGDETLRKKLPFNLTSCDVKFVDSIQPYRNRKVRILNGIHTALVPMSYLYGNRTVKESMDNAFTGKFVDALVHEEIVDTIDMDRSELIDFANEVFDRFRNPFIIHLLSSIALNSISKFKVRVLPSLLTYVQKNNRLPYNLTFSLAGLIRFYQGEFNGESLPVQDDEAIVSFMNEQWAKSDLNDTVSAILANSSFWGEDLSQIEGLTDKVVAIITDMDAVGIEASYNKNNA